jgi:AcrR family transcriptional regulator
MLTPRKSPAQARSAATVEALRCAAVQVLTGEGLDRCTTTRIAERAGTSVGSLYQYYPNRDALLSEVLERRLDATACAVERACLDSRGGSAAEMARALAAAFLSMKLSEPEKSKALYAVAQQLGATAKIDRLRARIIAAVEIMLVSAPDAEFDDPTGAATVAFGAMAGPVRILLEGQEPAALAARFEDELARLLTAYFQAHRPKG